MQNKFAGTSPNWAVRNPMAQMIALFTPAIARPDQCFRPTKIVDRMVRQQDK
jgi:hypothetical protein